MPPDEVSPDDVTPADDEPEQAEQGGDPACWLDRVCPDCGTLVETGTHDCPPPNR